MTPSRRTRRIPHPLAALAALPLLAPTLTACGGDSTDASELAEAVGAAGEAASEAVEATDEEVDAEIDAALEDLDALPDEEVLDQVGDTVLSVLSGATGYEVDGSTLYVDVSTDPAGALANCQIVLGAASALVDDPQVVLRYDGEDVDCSKF